MTSMQNVLSAIQRLYLPSDFQTKKKKMNISHHCIEGKEADLVSHTACVHISPTYLNTTTVFVMPRKEDALRSYDQH